MMEQYFTDGYQLKRYIENSGGWSDGEGQWEDIKPLTGHMRALNSNERTDISELSTTHRFYTKEKGIKYGDKIVKDGKEYKVKLVDNKKINTSQLDFMQIDCELII